MVSFKNIDWKLYFLLLIIILPLAIVTAFILPGLYKYLSFIWVFLFLSFLRIFTVCLTPSFCKGFILLVAFLGIPFQGPTFTIWFCCKVRNIV